MAKVEGGGAVQAQYVEPLNSGDLLEWDLELVALYVWCLYSTKLLEWKLDLGVVRARSKDKIWLYVCPIFVHSLVSADLSYKGSAGEEEEVEEEEEEEIAEKNRSPKKKKKSRRRKRKSLEEEEEQ
ncbi:hypothetical protein Q3G72_017932 [Acer saccharum]|nr:hypothetical protein Q3G72_017932 [Acer saccharum]